MGNPSAVRQSVLFEARQGGYHTYRIPALAVAGRGTIIAVCEARRQSSSDIGAIDLLVRRSVDVGETWSAPSVLVAGETGAAHNATMIVVPGSDEVHHLYCRDYKRAFHAISRDAGATFGPATEITPVFEQYRPEYDWVMIATGPGHGLRLRGGRLLVPVWLSASPDQKPTAASVIFSDDGGRSWRRGPIVVRDGDGAGVGNPMEPVLVELRDGRVMMNIRNASPAKRRVVTVSPDGVNGWSPLRFDAGLHEPFCMGSVCGMPIDHHGGKDAILYAGPDDLSSADHPGTANVGGCDRKGMTVKLSRDGGWTWPHARVLEPDWSGYSDLAVGPDGMIYCLYESGCVGGWMWDVKSLVLARFDEAWLARRP
ncbi:MAG: sialidase family protein [Planctomycetota bacterium]|nr:sialidase family protein [Planctomycetota bacterium]